LYVSRFRAQASETIALQTARIASSPIRTEPRSHDTTAKACTEAYCRENHTRPAIPKVLRTADFMRNRQDMEGEQHKGDLLSAEFLRGNKVSTRLEPCAANVGRFPHSINYVCITGAHYSRITMTGWRFNERQRWTRRDLSFPGLSIMPAPGTKYMHILRHSNPSLRSYEIPNQIHHHFSSISTLSNLAST
jgi:hypothetical protein